MAGPVDFLFELMRRGTLRLWWDARSGSWHDWSENGLTGQPGGSLPYDLRTDYLDFRPNTFVQLQPNAEASLRLNGGVLMALGDFKRWGRTPDAFASADAAISKYTNGAQRRYELGVNDTGIYFNGLASATLANDFRGCKSIAAKFNSNNPTAIYKDGINLGALAPTGILNPGTPIPFVFGNVDGGFRQSQNPLKAAVVVSELLPDVEVAQLHAALSAATWPRKQYCICTGRGAHLDWQVNEDPSIFPALGFGVMVPFYIAQGRCSIEEDNYNGKIVKVYRSEDTVPLQLLYGPITTEDLTAAAYGEWEFTWRIDFGAAGGNAHYFLSDLNFPVQNDYLLAEDAVGNWGLQVTVGGAPTVILNGNNPNPNVYHKWRVTRDAAGNWEVFLNGVSQGTVLDNTHTQAPVAYMELAENNSLVRSDLTASDSWKRVTP